MDQIVASDGAGLTTRNPSTWREYVSIARFDHATKHIFIIPGIVLATMFLGVDPGGWVAPVFFGFIVAVAIASANYTINEYLDRETDRHHPKKSARAAVQTEMSGTIVALQWLVLFCIGMVAAAMVSPAMLLVALGFAAQGIVYNVKPFRTKDIAYLDVLSEAVNNPFRLMIGWIMISHDTLPPSSILLAYWFGGAFLMGAKRLSEYRQIVASHGKDLLVAYRRSFGGYTEEGLTSSVMMYALLSISFLSIFLIKYRLEYLLLLPPIIFLFGRYLALSMHPESTAQQPERLFREYGLMLVVALIAVLFIVLSAVNIPLIEQLIDQRFIVFPWT